MHNEILEKQRLSWDKYSVGWDKWDETIANIILPVGDKMLDTLKLAGDEHILDVASGTGQPGISQARMLPNGKVTGLDLSQQMVNVANRKAAEKGISNYHSVCGDATSMPFEDNSFDHVLCRFGIMFFPNMVEGVSEMVRVLKPGGKVTLAVWAEPGNNPFLTILAGTAKEILQLPDPPPDSPGVFRCGASGLITQIMKDAGLQIISEESLSGNSTFESTEKYWTIMSEIAGPVMEQVIKAEPEMQQKVKETVLKNAESFLVGNEMITPWKTYIASGTK